MDNKTVGPKDTPYEGGYYFFDLKYPEDYPKILKYYLGQVEIILDLILICIVDGKVCLLHCELGKDLDGLLVIH